MATAIFQQQVRSQECCQAAKYRMLTFKEFYEARSILDADEPTSSAARLGNRILTRQRIEAENKNPVLSSALRKIRAAVEQSKKSVLGTFHLKVGSNELPNGTYTLQKLGLTQPEVTELRKAKLYDLDVTGTAVLKIEPY